MLCGMLDWSSSIKTIHSSEFCFDFFLWPFAMLKDRLIDVKNLVNDEIVIF